MKKTTVLYIVWAVLYCACVGFGFVSEPTQGEQIFLVALAMGFFVPPFLLAMEAKKEENRKTMLVLRLISGGVLLLTVILLVLNFLSVYFSSYMGLVLHVMLVMFTAPMVCGQYWFLSLFLWACLLMITLQNPNPYQK